MELFLDDDLEIVFCVDFFFFFFLYPMAAKLIGPRMGCQFFKKCLFFPHMSPYVVLTITFLAFVADATVVLYTTI